MKKEIQVNITLVQKDKYNWQEASKVEDSEIKYHASDADRRKELEGKTELYPLPYPTHTAIFALATPFIRD